MQKRHPIICKKNADFNIESKFFCIGSCFAEELGTRLKNYGLNTLINPFGTIYNAESLYLLLKYIFTKPCNFQTANFSEENGLHFSPYFSTKFSGRSKEQVWQKTLEKTLQVKKFLENCDVFIITFGTSVVFEYQNQTVANCHGLPHHLFKKKMLSVADNNLHIQNIIKLLKSELPGSHVILTLSPVRHSPNDAEENSLSKANLRAALGEIAANGQFTTKSKDSYFPAYEIVLDEYRDHAFYKQDDVHILADVATDITTRFINSYFSLIAREYLEKYKKIQQTLQHRPQKPKSEQYFLVLDKLANEINQLANASPKMKLFSLKNELIFKLLKYFPERRETSSIIKTLLSKNKKAIIFYLAALEYILTQNSKSAATLLGYKNKRLRKIKILCFAK